MSKLDGMCDMFSSSLLDQLHWFKEKCISHKHREAEELEAQQRIVCYLLHALAKIALFSLAALKAQVLAHFVY